MNHLERDCRKMSCSFFNNTLLRIEPCWYCSRAEEQSTILRAITSEILRRSDPGTANMVCFR